MKTTIAALALSLTILQPALSQSKVYGPYFPIGATPKSLKDFQCFGMSREGAGPNQLQGWVMTDRSKPDESTITMTKLSLNGTRLHFTAAWRNGTVFSFDGKLGRDGTAGGQVTKLVRGRKVASARMRFRAQPNAG